MEKTKLLSVFGLLSVLVLSLSLVSTLVEFTPDTLTGTGNDGTTITLTLNLDNDYSSDLSEITAAFTDLTKIGSSTTIAASNLALTNIDSTTIIVSKADLDATIDIQIPADTSAGTYEGEVSFEGTLTGGTPQPRGTVPITLTVTSTTSSENPEDIQDCVLTGNVGELVLKIEDINVKSGFGDDDEYWYPFDEIEVEVSVDNKGDWDIENIEVEWGLYNTDIEDFILDDKENDFDLDEGDDEETVIITFTLDKKIKKFTSGDTILYVWANGNIDDNDAGSNDEADVCAYDSYKADIRTDDKFVIATNVDMPETVSCEDDITVTFDVQNIGDEEQEDVFVTITNTELGINKKIEVGDIDDFEAKEFTALLQIPQDVEEKLYYLEFAVYDEDGDVYENEEDDKAEFLIPLKVLGTCGAQEPTITATLASSAIQGQDLIVQVSITNNADATDFLIFAEGYESWAELVSIQPSIVNIEKDGAKQIVITLKPTQTGSQTFTIKAVYSGKTVEQPVTVNIAEKTGAFTGAFGGVGDAGLYIISAVFLVLIIIIIALIVKVSRAGSAEF